MSYTIQSVVDAGDDRLVVTALDADGNEATGEGWVSATTNHYDVDADGNRTSETPRAMTEAEIGAYALSLLPVAVSAVTPTPIAFVAPS